LFNLYSRWIWFFYKRFFIYGLGGEEIDAMFDRMAVHPCVDINE
jgi:hypothetical protein